LGSVLAGKAQGQMISVTSPIRGSDQQLRRGAACHRATRTSGCTRTARTKRAQRNQHSQFNTTEHFRSHSFSPLFSPSPSPPGPLPPPTPPNATARRLAPHSSSTANTHQALSPPPLSTAAPSTPQHTPAQPNSSGTPAALTASTNYSAHLQSSTALPVQRTTRTTKTNNALQTPRQPGVFDARAATKPHWPTRETLAPKTHSQLQHPTRPQAHRTLRTPPSRLPLLEAHKLQPRPKCARPILARPLLRLALLAA
jgi:hypothetical protein